MQRFLGLLLLAVLTATAVASRGDADPLGPRHRRLIEKLADMPPLEIDERDPHHPRKMRVTPPKRTKRVHHERSDRLRSDGELLELARNGELFDIDIGDVYDISEGDLRSYMDKVRPSDLGAL